MYSLKCNCKIIKVFLNEQILLFIHLQARIRNFLIIKHLKVILYLCNNFFSRENCKVLILKRIGYIIPTINEKVKHNKNTFKKSINTMFKGNFLKV